MSESQAINNSAINENNGLVQDALNHLSNTMNGAKEVTQKPEQITKEPEIDPADVINRLMGKTNYGVY